MLPTSFGRWWVKPARRLAPMVFVLAAGALSPWIGGAQGSSGIDWRACGADLQCAPVAVPLDWAHPAGRRISLAVIRHLASDPGRSRRSLFFNPGGPGVSGVDTVRARGVDLDAIGGGRFDVVSWDPRGTNASTAVRCFTSDAAESRFWGPEPFPIGRADSQRYLAKTIGFDRRCGASTIPGLLAHITTADTTRDLDRLRRLVGERELTYLGWSYGTLIGETYANLFPRRVRAIVLDGVVDPIPTLANMEARLANSVAPADGVFARLEALCEQAGPDRCALAGHGMPVTARVDALLRALRRGPIPAPTAEPAGPLTYTDALVGIYGPLNGPAGWPQLAADLEQAVEGDGSALATGGRVGGLRSSLVPSQATHCADTPAGARPQAWPGVIGRLGRVSRLRGQMLGWWLWAPCTAWPARGANPYDGPWNARTKRPILVVGTRFDPATAYANARRVAGLLGSAVLLTHDGFGHTTDSDPSACAQAAIVRYLVDLVTPRPGTVCPSDRVPFDPDFGAPAPTAAARSTTRLIAARTSPG